VQDATESPKLINYEGEINPHGWPSFDFNKVFEEHKLKTRYGSFIAKKVNSKLGVQVKTLEDFEEHESKEVPETLIQAFVDKLGMNEPYLRAFLKYRNLKSREYFEYAEANEETDEHAWDFIPSGIVLGERTELDEEDNEETIKFFDFTNSWKGEYVQEFLPTPISQITEGSAKTYVSEVASRVYHSTFPEEIYYSDEDKEDARILADNVFYLAVLKEFQKKGTQIESYPVSKVIEFLPVIYSELSNNLSIQPVPVEENWEDEDEEVIEETEDSLPEEESSII